MRLSSVPRARSNCGGTRMTLTPLSRFSLLSKIRSLLNFSFCRVGKALTLTSAQVLEQETRDLRRGLPQRLKRHLADAEYCQGGSVRKDSGRIHNRPRCDDHRTVRSNNSSRMWAQPVRKQELSCPPAMSVRRVRWKLMDRNPSRHLLVRLSSMSATTSQQ